MHLMCMCACWLSIRNKFLDYLSKNSVLFLYNYSELQFSTGCLGLVFEGPLTSSNNVCPTTNAKSFAADNKMFMQQQKIHM